MDTLLLLKTTFAISVAFSLISTLYAIFSE